MGNQSRSNGSSKSNLIQNYNNIPRIQQINVEGINRLKSVYLFKFANDNRGDILLLQETHYGTTTMLKITDEISNINTHPRSAVYSTQVKVGESYSYIYKPLLSPGSMSTPS